MAGIAAFLVGLAIGEGYARTFDRLDAAEELLRDAGGGKPRHRTPLHAI